MLLLFVAITMRMRQTVLPAELQKFIARIACVVVQVVGEDVLEWRGAANPISLNIWEAFLVPQIILKRYI